MKPSPVDNVSKAPSVAPGSCDNEWELVSTGDEFSPGACLTRPLRGSELLVSYSEFYSDGNFQLVLKAWFETTLTSAQLEKRHQAAWWQTRRRHPIVGVALLDPDRAVFELQHSSETARKWAEQTCRVASGTTVNQAGLGCARAGQPLPMPIMTLIHEPVRGGRGCVLHTSHALNGHEGYRILEDFISQLGRPENEGGVDGVFTVETIDSVTPGLPQSLSHAYSRRFQPTDQYIKDALRVHQQAQTRWTRKSVGIPLCTDWQTRPSRIHNKTVEFEAEEAAAAFKCLKKANVSLTSAFFACMTSAIAHAFGQGDEDGAHLLFSANGGRWIDVRRCDGRGPIAMSIVPAGMWIDGAEVDIRATSQTGLLTLAKAIARAQEQDLVSPHVIRVVEQLAPSLAKAMAGPQEFSSPPLISRPTLTSQGRFGDRLIAGHPGDDLVKMTDFNTGGRNTDPSVCFALLSFRDELKFNLLFDERYFDQKDVLHLGHSVSALFRRLIAGQPAPARL